MPDRVQALLGEIEDHLQHLPAVGDPAERRELVAAVGDALHGLAELMSRRRWPRVVRDGLPGGATFIRLTEEESAALLADIQDAYGELQDRLAVVEAQLLSCRKHLHAATAVDDDKVLAAALLRRGADLTSQQQAAVTTLLAAAGPDPASAANRSRPGPGVGGQPQPAAAGERGADPPAGAARTAPGHRMAVADRAHRAP